MDKAKLYHEIDLLKEKNAGWKKLHENSSSSMKMLQALVMEQKEELVKLRIEHPAAVKVRNAAVEQMMKARVEKSRVMDRMKKMAEETRKEMEVVCRWGQRFALPLMTRGQLLLQLILRSCADRVCGGPRSSWGWASGADDSCVGGLRREVGVRAGKYVGPVLQEAAGKLLGELKCGSRSELFRRVVE